MNIDWSKAPEWAVGHALHAFGGEISEVWVGEEQYQRLDQSKPFPYGGGSLSAFHNPRRYQFRYETLRPSPWIGEGLPPVGAELEAGFACEGFKIWHKGVCVAVGEDPEGREDLCVVQFGKKLAQYSAEGHRMRPIRTPEQIAAEECRGAVNELGDILIASRGIATEYHQAGLIYAAGYRKQVAP